MGIDYYYSSLTTISDNAHSYSTLPHCERENLQNITSTQVSSLEIRVNSE
jgi:hypothetical protein